MRGSRKVRGGGGRGLGGSRRGGCVFFFLVVMVMGIAEGVYIQSTLMHGSILFSFVMFLFVMYLVTYFVFCLRVYLLLARRARRRKGLFFGIHLSFFPAQCKIRTSSPVCMRYKVRFLTKNAICDFIRPILTAFYALAAFFSKTIGGGSSYTYTYT